MELFRALNERLSRMRENTISVVSGNQSLVMARHLADEDLSWFFQESLSCTKDYARKMVDELKRDHKKYGYEGPMALHIHRSVTLAHISMLKDIAIDVDPKSEGDSIDYGFCTIESLVVMCPGFFNHVQNSVQQRRRMFQMGFRSPGGVIPNLLMLYLIRQYTDPFSQIRSAVMTIRTESGCASLHPIVIGEGVTDRSNKHLICVKCIPNPSVLRGCRMYTMPYYQKIA